MPDRAGGGLKDNAIPRTTRMLLAIDGGEKEILKEEASRFTENLCREYSGTDDGITVTVEKTGEGATPALHPVSLQKTVFFLMNLPNGVQKMSGQIPGLVETSLNLGILKLEPDHLHACASVRSSVGSAKEALSDKLEYLIGFLGGEFHVEGAYRHGSIKRILPSAI